MLCDFCNDNLECFMWCEYIFKLTFWLLSCVTENCFIIVSQIKSHCNKDQNQRDFWVSVCTLCCICVPPKVNKPAWTAFQANPATFWWHRSKRSFHWWLNCIKELCSVFTFCNYVFLKRTYNGLIPQLFVCTICRDIVWLFPYISIVVFFKSHVNFVSYKV